MVGVILAKLRYQRRDFAFVFNVERLQHIESPEPLIGLSCYNPVDIGIVVHADADRCVAVKVTVGAAIHCFRVVVVAESVEILKIAVVILVPFFHRGVESITGDADFLAHNRRLEREWSEVTFHVAQVLLTKQLHILHT